MIASGLTAGLAGFAIYLCAMLLLLRLTRIEPALLAMAASVFVFAAHLVWLALFGEPLNVWVYATSYWFFALVFLLAFGAIYKSISLRILADLLGREGRSERYESVLARFIVAESYQNRLKVIVQNDLATLVEGRYALNARGLRLARIIRGMQKLFGITRSG